MSRVGDLLKVTREKVGYTQADLSERLGYTSPQFISNIERGLASLPIDKVASVSRLLKLDVDAIIDAKADDEKAKFRAAVNGGYKKKRVS